MPVEATYTLSKIVDSNDKTRTGERLKRLYSTADLSPPLDFSNPDRNRRTT